MGTSQKSPVDLFCKTWDHVNKKKLTGSHAEICCSCIS